MAGAKGKKTSSGNFSLPRPTSFGLMVDVPHYCPKCGAQYYVSGGAVEVWEGKRRRIYEVSGPEGDVRTFPKEPLCPSCLVKLLDISYIEEVFEEEIRSF